MIAALIEKAIQHRWLVLILVFVALLAIAVRLYPKLVQ